MKRKKSARDVVKDKIGDDSGYSGSMRFMAPSGGRYLVKNGDDEETEVDKIEEALLREVIAEIVRKCGDDWCLYTKKKDKKTGKRRRLGTHGSKADAYRQERAIKASGG